MDDIWSLLIANPVQGTTSIYGHCFTRQFHHIDHRTVDWWSRWPTTLREVDTLRQQRLFPLNSAYYESTIGIVIVYDVLTRTVHVYLPNDPAFHGVKVCLVRSELVPNLTYYKIDPNVDVDFPPTLRLFLHTIPIRYVGVFASPFSTSHLRGDEQWLTYPTSLLPVSTPSERKQYIDWLLEDSGDNNEIMNIMQQSAPTNNVMARQLYLKAMRDHYDHERQKYIQRMSGEFEEMLKQLITDHNTTKIITLIRRELNTSKAQSCVQDLSNDERQQALNAIEAIESVRVSYFNFQQLCDITMTERQLVEIVFDEEARIQEIIDRYVNPALGEIALVSRLWRLVCRERQNSTLYVMNSYYVNYLGRLTSLTSTTINYDEQLLADLMKLPDSTGRIIAERLRAFQKYDKLAAERLDERVQTVKAYTQPGEDTLVAAWSLDRMREMFTYHEQQQRLRTERQQKLAEITNLAHNTPPGAKQATLKLNALIENRTDWERYLSQVPAVIERNGRSVQELHAILSDLVDSLNLTVATQYTDNSKPLKDLFPLAFATALGTDDDSWFITTDQVSLLDNIARVCIEVDSRQGTEIKTWSGWPYSFENRNDQSQTFWNDRNNIDVWVKELSKFELLSPPLLPAFPYDIRPLTGAHLVVSPHFNALVGKTFTQTWDRLVSDLFKQAEKAKHAHDKYFETLRSIEQFSVTTSYNQMRIEAKKLCRTTAHVDSDEWWWGLSQYLGKYGDTMTPVNPYRLLLDIVSTDELRYQFVDMLSYWTVDWRATQTKQLDNIVDDIVTHLKKTTGAKHLFETSSLLLHACLRGQVEDWCQSAKFAPTGVVSVCTDEGLEGLFSDGSKFAVEADMWNSLVAWQLRLCLARLRQAMSEQDVCAQLPKWMANVESKWLLTRGNEYDDPNTNLEGQKSFKELLLYSALSTLTLDTLLYQGDEIMATEEFSVFTLNNILGAIHPYAALHRFKCYRAAQEEDTAVIYQRFRGLDRMTDYTPPPAVHGVQETNVALAKIVKGITIGGRTSQPVVGLAEAVELLSGRFAIEQFPQIVRANVEHAVAENMFSMFFAKNDNVLSLGLTRPEPGQSYTFDNLCANVEEINSIEKLGEISGMRFVKRVEETSPQTVTTSSTMDIVEEVKLRTSAIPTTALSDTVERWMSRVGQSYQHVKDERNNKSLLQYEEGDDSEAGCIDVELDQLADSLGRMHLETDCARTTIPTYALVDPLRSTRESPIVNSLPSKLIIESGVENEEVRDELTGHHDSSNTMNNGPTIFKIYSNDLKAYLGLRKQITEVLNFQ